MIDSTLAIVFGFGTAICAVLFMIWHQHVVVFNLHKQVALLSLQIESIVQNVNMQRIFPFQPQIDLPKAAPNEGE